MARATGVTAAMSKRAKIRQLEAQRDKLTLDKKNLDAKLATVRADLKHQRKVK